MAHQHSRPAALYWLVAALLFQGVSAIAGGIGLVSDPSGANLQFPVGLLHGSPFDDYLVPGLILLIGLGLFPLFVVYGLWRRRAWSWYAALLVGLALIIWIVVETIIIGYLSQPPLQLIYGALGVVILVLASLPSVRQYFASNNLSERLVQQ